MKTCPLGTIDKNIAGPKYRVLGPIGQGQFGRVFCGIHRQTGKIVALKQLDNSRLTTPRFLHELNLLASLQHPNIVAFHTLEYSKSGRYLVMDYCEGGTLRQLIDTPGQLNLKQSLQLVIDVVEGLAHAHQRGIVHCDLKPENVLLTLTATGWMAHLSDFGVARLLAEPDSETRRGDTGSPAYMAPERFYSSYSPASDFYAAGVLLYELVLGHRPFSGTPGDLMTAHLNQFLEIPDTIPTVVSDIIRQATQKLPQKRFDSAQSMLKLLRLAAAAEERPTPISPPSELPVLHTTALAATVLALATDADQLYCGLDSQVTCQSITPAGFDEPTQYPITQGRVMQMWSSPQGLFIRTQRATAHALCWRPKASENEAAQDSSVHTLGTWQSESLKMTVESGGEWLGVATESSRLGGQCQILRLPTLQPRCSVAGSPTHWLTLDDRRGIMAIPEAQGVCLRLFNRRGNTFDYCRLPRPIHQLIQSQTHPYQVLALAAEASFWITLNPLRIKQIALPLSPTFGVATPWGYLLANQTGGVALINESGDLLRHLNLPVGNQDVVSEIASHQSQLIAATWSGQHGALYSFDLQPFIQ
ncbi:Serine/threonine-protein kinase, photosystem II assembly protein [Acaryochloris thomasi RCC1774]|uniref:Serine/threonine-protein kinase, photosystem II assembly protein n=1 Tax=Acaryochloris thomasi RCC1774 TaxID=1764569 RepID=A0A2W1JZ33_9CYAN|nr:serine/threonine-protein kinase [Acaryochloris thomasi]PZD73427.1 Serine/threonine-protein kinase, photosystem II assembly protein [Acaryochloris thomasi RCC1774]